MPASRVAILSDIHIGNNAPTCWYQKKIHAPYLEAALNWIAGRAGSFQEVILLGDLVDTWTYPPGVPPPSMAEIIEANPEILGKGGALAKVVAAVPKVSFLLGNHDGTLTSADIETLRDQVGPIELVDPIYTLAGSTGKKTVFSHGHHWTMFNAPDPESPWDTLPVGHFVTRAFSYKMARELPHERNVAELKNMGYPDGFEILPFLRAFGENMNSQLGPLLLDYAADSAKMPKDTNIVLPGGQGSTTIEEAKEKYGNLFARWEQEEGLANAIRAAMADGSGEYLAWAAQRLAIQQSADLVVFGHTHTPVGGLLVSPVDYFNGGFECASAPDCPPKEFNFTIVDLETAAAQIMQIATGTYRVEGAEISALSSVIIPPFRDYSCYVRILNQSSQPLTLASSEAPSGYWPVTPTATIPAGGRGDGWLQDKVGLEGSEGSFVYQRAGNPLNFSVACPTGSANRASSPNDDFIAKSGSGEWQQRGVVPSLGYPLQVIFTVED
jgi:UDP-2,3-diacylglucosamine pyrophosphatase LpxH